MKAFNLAIKDRNGLVLGAAQGLRNELRQNAIRVVLEKLTPIKVKHLARHSLQDEPLSEDVMADALHILFARIATRATVCRANACGMAPSAGPAIGRRLPSPELHPKSDDCRNIAGAALFGATEKIRRI